MSRHEVGIHLTASTQSKMAKREPLRALLLWWLPLLCEYRLSVAMPWRPGFGWGRLRVGGGLKVESLNLMPATVR